MSSVVLEPGSERVEKYQFDGFELFPRQQSLWRHGSRIALTPKPFQILTLLVEHAGQTLSKDELLAKVWHGAAVEENNLTQSISALRKVFGEKRGENRYIATDPGLGYRFVATVSRVMENIPVAAPPQQPPPSRAPRRHHPLAIAGGVLCLVAAMGCWFALRRPSGPMTPRNPVAVLPLRDLSKAPAETWLRAALAEMLSAELSAGGKLRAVPEEDIARWEADLGGAGEEAGQTRILRSAQRSLGAATLVVGSYVVIGTCPECRLRLDLDLADAKTGNRWGTIIEEGSAADILDVATRAGRRLRAELGDAVDQPVSPRWPSANAMREYAEGVAALHRMEPQPALDQLKAASAAEPGNPLIHSALAEAWTALGYGTRAQEEDRRAFELSSSLSRIDRLGIEAHYRSSLKDWDRAIQIYRSVFELFPDSLDDGLKLAQAQWRASRLADCSATLTALRKLPKPAGDDPRIDLMEARTAGTLNDYARTRVLAHRAAEEAKARGTRYIFARARLLEGGAMQNMGLPGFASVQAEARQTCQDIGDKDCLAKAWRIQGNDRFSAGDLAAARESYQRGITIARELGNRAELANLLVGLGVVAKADRDFAAAERNLLEATALRIETGFDPTEVRNTLADLYLSMGQLDDAERSAQTTEAAARRSGAHEDLGGALQIEADLARTRGHLEQAQRLGEAAVAELSQTENPVVLALALAQLSSVQIARGNNDRAEWNLSKAVPKEAPESQGAVELARAELWDAKGRFQESALAAARAASAFDKAHLDHRTARAFFLEADSLDALGRSQDASSACREAGKRATRTPNAEAGVMARLCLGVTKIPDMGRPELKLRIDFARAMNAKRTGAADAADLFARVAADAEKQGYVSLARRAHDAGVVSASAYARHFAQ